MTARLGWLSCTLLALVASGCPKDDNGGGAGTAEDGGNHVAGTGGSSSNGGNGQAHGGGKSGSGGSASAGTGGTSGGGAARDGGGTQLLDAGSSGGIAGACKVSGCSGELCVLATDDIASPCIYRDEFACYKNALCLVQGSECAWKQTPELQKCLASANGGSGSGGSSGGALKWYQTCGTPVCMANDKPYDDPNIPNCTKDEQEGSTCSQKDVHCDGVAGCGATLVCSDKDPTAGPGGCPISRARYKQDIEYLSEHELRAYHKQIMSLPLAAYRYKNAPASPQLGFIIDDVEPSVAVAGDHVNMYGYLSMAVAAIQVQQKQIEALEHEVERLRAVAEPAPMCNTP